MRQSCESIGRWRQPIASRHAPSSGFRRARRLNCGYPSAAQSFRHSCATSRWIVVNSNDSAFTGPAQARQRLGFETFDIDLDEGGFAVA